MLYYEYISQYCHNDHCLGVILWGLLCYTFESGCQGLIERCNLTYECGKAETGSSRYCVCKTGPCTYNMYGGDCNGHKIEPHNYAFAYNKYCRCTPPFTYYYIAFGLVTSLCMLSLLAASNQWINETSITEESRWFWLFYDKQFHDNCFKVIPI